MSSEPGPEGTDEMLRANGSSEAEQARDSDTAEQARSAEAGGGEGRGDQSSDAVLRANAQGNAEQARNHRLERTYRTNAVVLRTYKSGEADRIVVLMTEAEGKVRAVAKGARKSKRTAALLDSLAHVDVQLYRGKGDLDTVTQVQAVDTFPSIRSDLDRFTRAASFVEATDHVTLDREPHDRLYRMLVGALRTVDGENPTLTSAGFFLKLLALEGLEPVLDRCVSCGSDGPLVSFDAINSGTRCSSCRSGIPLSDEGIRICRLILSGGLAAALKLPDGPVLDDVNRLAATMVEHQTERRLKSLSTI